MYLIEQAREIPHFLRNWQSFKLTKFVVVVVWCQFHSPFHPKKKTRMNPWPWSTIFLSPWYQTILAWGLASLALQLICLSVPAFTAIPESVLISSSLEGGTGKQKLFGLTWNSNDYIWGWDDGLWCGNSPVPGELLLLCNYTSIMATTTTTISHAFA